MSSVPQRYSRCGFMAPSNAAVNVAVACRERRTARASRRTIVHVLLAGLAACVLAQQAPAQVLAYAAAFVTQTAPASIEIMKPAAVSITMRNTGTLTWRAAEGDVFLATQEPQDNYY